MIQNIVNRKRIFMKKIVFAFIFFLGLFIVSSCKKQIHPNGQQQIINATLKSNTAFQYDFGLTGFEDNISITQQAKNYETSELKRDDSGKFIYTYKPGKNYAGTDEVVVSHGISNGSTIVNTMKTIIKLTITKE